MTGGAFADGTVGAPSISFLSDTNTGFYRIGSDNVGLSLGGSKVFDVADSLFTFYKGSSDTADFDLTIKKSRGTVAAPTVITSGDRLGSLQFAGYSGAGGYVAGALIRAVSEGTIASGRVGAYLSFQTGTDAAPTVMTERMRITSGGNVGINFGTMLAWPTSGNNRGVQLGALSGILTNNSTSLLGIMSNEYYNGTNYTYSSTAAGAILELLSGGFTFFTAPSGTSGTTATNTAIFRIDNAGNAGFNHGTMLSWGTTGVTRGFQVGPSSGFTASSNSPDWSLYTNLYWNGTATTYSTTSPASRLSLLYNRLVYSTAPSGTIDTTATMTERFRIDNDGNAGLNYGTMLAWATTGTSRALQIGAYGGIVGRNNTSGLTNLSVFQNAYFGGSDWKYSSTATASWLEFSAGALTFYTAPSGTVDTNITWTERFQVSNVGNVGINGAPSARLHITETNSGYAMQRWTNSANGSNLKNWQMTNQAGGYIDISAINDAWNAVNSTPLTLYNNGNLGMGNFGTFKLLGTGTGITGTGLKGTVSVASGSQGLIILASDASNSYSSYHVYAYISFGTSSLVPQLVLLGGANGGFDTTHIVSRLAATGNAYEVGIYFDTNNTTSRYKVTVLESVYA